MKPTEALDIRANFKSKCGDSLWKELVKQTIMISSGAKFYKEKLASTHEQKEDIIIREKAIEVYVEDAIRAGMSAECFFIKDEMTDLILFASEKLDETDLFDPTLAPTDKGFAYFEKPVPLIDVRGRKLLINIITWEKIFNEETGNFQITMSCWNDTARTPDEVAIEIISSKNKALQELLKKIGRFHWINSEMIKSGIIVGSKEIKLTEKALQEIKETTFDKSYGVKQKDNSFDYNRLSDKAWEEYKEKIITNPTNIVRILHAYWLLMSQTIVEQSKEKGDRAQRRRLERENCPTEVVVIQFRKRKYYNERGEETEESKKIDWSHRWLVGGHWRWQPYKDPVSKGEIKKRIWINPYVKGPEDKPLVMKDKVYVLAR
jgi:hypothetical protein